MKIIYELGEEQKNLWSREIKTSRQALVKRPSMYIERYVNEHHISQSEIKSKPSKSIEAIREGCWNLYLEDEVIFHKEVIKNLLQENEIPKEILGGIIRDEFVAGEMITLNDAFCDRIAGIIGDYSGRVMPYLYYLSLSTTNSRRSRAGKTFEGIIESILDVYGYPFENQSKLGKKFYATHNVGKMVDCILPNKSAYELDRTRCMIVTMKTTLRERWQEVVEEITRTNIPQIFLMTLDEGLTAGVLTNIKQQNITIVTYERIKREYEEFNNIMSFEEFFNEEIPYRAVHWNEDK